MTFAMAIAAQKRLCGPEADVEAQRKPLRFKGSLRSPEAALGGPVVAFAAQEWLLRPRGGLCGLRGPEAAFAAQRESLQPRGGLYSPEIA